jgi:hypothetical protein
MKSKVTKTAAVPAKAQMMQVLGQNTPSSVKAVSKQAAVLTRMAEARKREASAAAMQRKEVKQQRGQVAREESHNKRQAMQLLGTTVAPTPAWHKEEPGPAPAWAARCHASHELFHGAGIVFCKECGGIASTPSSGSLLFVMCGSLKYRQDDERAKIAPGSKGRLNRLLRGQLPYDFNAWPDGRAGRVRISVCRVPSGSVESPQPSAISVAEAGVSDGEYEYVPAPGVV